MVAGMGRGVCGGGGVRVAVADGAVAAPSRIENNQDGPGEGLSNTTADAADAGAPVPWQDPPHTHRPPGRTQSRLSTKWYRCWWSHGLRQCGTFACMHSLFACKFVWSACTFLFAPLPCTLSPHVEEFPGFAPLSPPVLLVSLNPKPYTQHPEPSTLNRKPYFCKSAEYVSKSRHSCVAERLQFLRQKEMFSPAICPRVAEGNRQILLVCCCDKSTLPLCSSKTSIVNLKP